MSSIIDLVNCNGVLHHKSDSQGGFHFIVRKLKRDGCVTIGLYNLRVRLPTL